MLHSDFYGHFVAAVGSSFWRQWVERRAAPQYECGQRSSRPGLIGFPSRRDCSPLKTPL